MELQVSLTFVRGFCMNYECGIVPSLDQAINYWHACMERQTENVQGTLSQGAVFAE